MLPTSPAADPLEESAEYQAFRRFAKLTVLKKGLKAKLKLIEAQLKVLEQPLLTCFSSTDLEQIKVGDFLMSPVREPWVYPLATVSRKAVCEALKLSGLNHLVSEVYYTRSLTKYVRDLETHYNLTRETDTEAVQLLLPTPLAQVVEVKPSYRLRVLDRRPNKPNFDLNDFEDSEEGDEYDHAE